MKRFLIVLSACLLLVLTSCETTREITIDPKGGGTISTTNDLSGLLGLAKMSGQNEEMEKMERPIDTSINLATMADSIADISAEDRALVSKGKMNFVMNMDEEKFQFKLDFPFTKTSEIAKIDQISGKVLQQATKKQMGAAGGEEAENPMKDMANSSPNDFFVTTYNPGLIEMKLDTVKFKTIEDNEMMNSMKEMAGMGMGKTTTIINLPKPAKSATGNGVTLSADKKKVTIVSTLEDFFNDAKKMEYRIEY